MRSCYALAMLAWLSGGCATICPNPYDAQYGHHGGVWQRSDPCQGRVASEFTPEASVTAKRTSPADIPYTPLITRQTPAQPEDFNFDDLYDPDPPPRPDGVETRAPGEWISR